MARCATSRSPQLIGGPPTATAALRPCALPCPLPLCPPWPACPWRPYDFTDPLPPGPRAPAPRLQVHLLEFMDTVSSDFFSGHLPRPILSAAGGSDGRGAPGAGVGGPRAERAPVPLGLQLEPRRAPSASAGPGLPAPQSLQEGTPGFCFLGKQRGWDARMAHTSSEITILIPESLMPFCPFRGLFLT